jgi:hypothetical protein
MRPIEPDTRARARRERLAPRGLVETPPRGLPTWACAALALTGFACGVLAAALAINGWV